MLYSDALFISVMHTPAVQHYTELSQVPNVLCQTTFPPLPSTRQPAPSSRIACTTTRPAPPEASTTTRTGKETSYSRYNLRYKFTANGIHYVQGKDDPLLNMLPVEMGWDKHTFSSSEHIYVYELLKGMVN